MTDPVLPVPPEGAKVVTEAVPPIPVTVVGSTGDGGIPKGLLTTPPGQANVVVTVINPMVAILVRAANLFFVSLSGLVTGKGVGIFDSSFKTLVLSAGAVTLVGVIKDCATVFGGLEKKFPLASGSV